MVGVLAALGAAVAVGVLARAAEVDAGEPPPITTATTAVTTTSTEPPTTTTGPPTTTTSAPPAPGALALQQRLSELGYWLGEPDGDEGDLTTQAVLAFQKVHGLERDGRAGPATLEALASATRPVPRTLTDGIEIDLARQVLFVVRDGEVRWVLNTSTGSSRTPTPPGEFTIVREIDGVRHAPLGRLYRPKYFNGGIAIHGYGSVPAQPASHGCARVSNPAMDLLWASGLAEVGTPVRVV